MKNSPVCVFCIHGGAGVISKDIDGTKYLIALEKVVKEVAAFSQRGK